jgi:membrane protein YdbS with pleckstrin-like domain
MPSGQTEYKPDNTSVLPLAGDSCAEQTLEVGLSQEKEGLEWNLKSLFPCAKQKSFRYSFPQFSVFLVVFLAAGAVNFFYIRPYIGSFEEQMRIRDLMLIPIALSFFLWLGFFSYWKIGGRHLSYWIERGEVCIKKGIMLQNSGFFPIHSITDVYLEQTPLDWFFSTYTAVISTANDNSGKFARIQGLSKDSAFGIQEHLRALISTNRKNELGGRQGVVSRNGNVVGAEQNSSLLQ